MQTWINFWTLIFWISLFGFLINLSSFINLLFFSELTWLTIYVLSTIFGAVNDDITLTSLTFFILGLAGLEFSFGFLLLILFKNFNVSIELLEDSKIFSSIIEKNKNNLYLENYFWTK